MAGEMSLHITEDSLTPMLDKLATGLTDRSARAALDLAPRILQAAKRDAPWEDRTGKARAGLDVDVDVDGDQVVIQLYHSVDYGLWLEVIQSGRFATIMPTLETWGQAVANAVGDKVVME